MAAGDTSVQIVTAPINAATVKTAVDDAIAATSTGSDVMMASFNDGRGVVVVALER